MAWNKLYAKQYWLVICMNINALGRNICFCPGHFLHDDYNCLDPTVVSVKELSRYDYLHIMHSCALCFISLSSLTSLL